MLIQCAVWVNVTKQYKNKKKEEGSENFTFGVHMVNGRTQNGVDLYKYGRMYICFIVWSYIAKNKRKVGSNLKDMGCEDLRWYD